MNSVTGEESCGPKAFLSPFDFKRKRYEIDDVNRSFCHTMVSRTVSWILSTAIAISPSVPLAAKP